MVFKKGHIVSEETKRKISLSKIPWNKGRHDLINTWNKGKKILAETGEKNYNWKGGKSIDRYIRILMRDHPKADCKGYVYEHIVVMEKSLGRLLQDKECIHHLNENPKDNRIENLILCKNSSEHMTKFHKLRHKQNGQFE